MTQHEENCPTCGSRLSALNRAELRRCSACRRNNPVGFLFCGYCAAPMEHSEIRPRSAEVAAPPGGWPNLAGDLAEVKFFLKQGQLDEAYDLLSILQRRYPGHPELADFAHSTESAPPPDAEVEHLVDSVLADSASLGGKLPRRRATPWDAPASEPIERRGRKLTTAHEVVRAALIEDVDEDDPETNPKAKVVVAEYAKNPRPARKPLPKVEHTNAFEALPPKRMPKVKLRQPSAAMPKPKLWRSSVDTAKAVGEAARKVQDQVARANAPTKELSPLPPRDESNVGKSARVHMPPVRADEDSPRVTSVDPSEATTKKEVAAQPKKEPLRTVAVDALQPAAPYAHKQNQTIAVDALQPAAPFEGEAPEAFEARKEQIKRATSPTGRRRRVTGANKSVQSSNEANVAKGSIGSKKKRPRGVPPTRPDGDEETRRSRSTAFGAGVLSRFGR